MEYPDYKEHFNKTEYIQSVKSNIEAIKSANSSKRHKKDLLDICIWHLTEIDGKWNTRFRSEGAMDAKNWEDVQHEHVYQRKNLILRLLGRESIDAVIKDAIGCLVTKTEHKLLGDASKNFKVDGWERYIRAGIQVYDLKYKQPYILVNTSNKADEN